MTGTHPQTLRKQKAQYSGGTDLAGVRGAPDSQAALFIEGKAGHVCAFRIHLPGQSQSPYSHLQPIGTVTGQETDEGTQLWS